MPLNFELAGKKYDPIEVVVTGAQIAAYASASGDYNPRYQEGPGQIASPIFPVVPAFPEMGRVTSDPELGVENPLMIVHGEEELRYHAPIRPGDELLIEPSLDRVEDKGSGAIYVTKVAASTGGKPVVDTWATIFVRGAGSGEERDSTPKFSQEKGEEAAAFTSHVDEDMPVRYAEASGDHNPIHLDDAVATAVGLPGVINHGLGTLSLVTGGLVDSLAGGDASRLSHIKVRFTDMVFPGSELSTTVWHTAGEGSFEFETTRPDGVAVMQGGLSLS